MEIKYPYMPEGREIKFVDEDNEYIQLAKEIALKCSMDSKIPVASVLANNGKVIGIGANGSDFHEHNECERVRRKVPSGQGYELCEGCHPKNHSELAAINYAKSKGNKTLGSSIYIWGHWWACKPCWDQMIGAGVKEVYLLKESKKLFDFNSPDNIIGQGWTNKPK